MQVPHSALCSGSYPPHLSRVRLSITERTKTQQQLFSSAPAWGPARAEHRHTAGHSRARESEPRTALPSVPTPRLTMARRASAASGASPRESRGLLSIPGPARPSSAAPVSADSRRAAALRTRGSSPAAAPRGGRAPGALIVRGTAAPAASPQPAPA